MEEEQLLQIIKEAAFEVRRNLAKGYVESVYQNALMIELRLRGLKAEKEIPIPVVYKNYRVGDFRADILVENRIILELKAVGSLAQAHELQLINYLTATGLNYGVLINYGGDDYSFRIKTKDYPPKRVNLT